MQCQLLATSVSELRRTWPHNDVESSHRMWLHPPGVTPVSPTLARHHAKVAAVLLWVLPPRISVTTPTPFSSLTFSSSHQTTGYSSSALRSQRYVLVHVFAAGNHA